MPTTQASRRGSHQVRARAQTDESAGIVGALGPRIAKERLVRGLSLEDLAERAGISRGLLSQLERGIGNPSLTTLAGLAAALDVPLGSFFAGGKNNDDIVVRRNARKRVCFRYRLMAGPLQILWCQLLG